MGPALLLLLAITVSGCAGLAPGLGGKLNATEKMMWSTYPLGTEKGMATGFVVAKKDAAGEGGVRPVVVTSIHVLKTLGRGPLFIGTRIPDVSGHPEVMVLRLQPSPGKTLFYVRHPTHDIAAFELTFAPQPADSLVLPSFLEEKALLRPRPRLRAGTDVSFLGFPEVLPGTGAAFPILRSGRVASYPADALGSPGMFLINTDVYPGDSGAPVFLTGSSGRPEMVGMVIRRVGTDRREQSHFAVAVGADAIRETLQLLAARKRPAGANR